MNRPTLLITDALNAQFNDPIPRKTRDNSLIGICFAYKDLITERMRYGGNVLIPVQTSTRVLEILYLLDTHWSKNRLQTNLIFLSHQSVATLNCAKSMLEWYF